MELMFWVILFFPLYNYILFPVFLIIYSFFHHMTVKKAYYTPKVTLLISAYKEETIIRQKIENSLKLDYPSDKLEIIIATDGNEDRTADIVNEYKEKGIILSHRNERGGKVAAINRGVALSTGDIILLSDANAMYHTDAVRKITQNFADFSIGGVTGRKFIAKAHQRASTKGDRAYWKYESIIKQSQSKLGSVSTADGEIFAFKKSLFTPVPEYIINDDTALTFNIVQQGYRVIYEPQAVSSELASQNLKDDYYVKVRMVAGGYQSVVQYANNLFPPKSFFSFQFLSHKLLRWMAPVFLLMLLFINIFILHGIYLLCFISQVIFYALALFGLYRFAKKDDIGIFYFPLYFVLMNSAAFAGLIRHFTGNSQVSKIWRRAER